MNIRKELKKYLFKNLANIVTIIGFLAVIWLLVIIINRPEKLWLIGLLVLIAGLSDFFDGKIARKLKIESKFGAVTDHLRDKIFIGPILIILIWRQNLEAINLPFIAVGLATFFIIYIVAIEIILFIACAILFLFKKIKIKASKWGKWKMFCEFLAIIIWLISLIIEKYFLIPVLPFSIHIINLILFFALCLSFGSLKGYWRQCQ